MNSVDFFVVSVDAVNLLANWCCTVFPFQRYKDRQADRLAERQTDWKTDKETDRQAYQHTERQMDRECVSIQPDRTAYSSLLKTDRMSDRQTGRQTERQKWTERYIQTDTNAHGKTDK